MKFSKDSTRLIVAGAAAILVLITAFVGSTPLLNAETGHIVTDARLVHSAAYTILSPICTILDALTLLSLSQHAATLATVLLVVIAWRLVRARSQDTSRRHEVRVALATLGCIVLVYGAGAAVPRPMDALHVYNPDDVVIDFHSHTNFSWDGRTWFTPERNRQWHAATGFDAGYITDHKTLAGANAAYRRNPARAGEGTILLPGLEARDHDEHVVAIGIDSTFPVASDGEWREPPQDTALAVTASAPLLILTMPGDMAKIPESEKRGFAHLYAVEVSDAAPRGIGAAHRQKPAIMRLADSLDLALVSGSDNHGWGSTAVAWSVMQIPGWRSMNPAQLDSAIQRGIRIERRHAVRVYMRDSPDPGSSTLATLLTAPLVIWRVLADLDWAGRISWIGWIVLIASIATMLSSRAARDTIPPAARRKPDRT